MVVFPLPYVLHIRRFTTVVNEYGDDETSWGAPEPWPVHAVAPGPMEEPWRSARDLSVIAYTVYAPADGPRLHEQDVVVVDGEDYQVDGRPMDYSRGPWQMEHAGIVVALKRAEG